MGSAGAASSGIGSAGTSSAGAGAGSGAGAAGAGTGAGSGSADAGSSTGTVDTPDASPAVAANIQIVAGNPSGVEIAAVTAVLTGVLEELAGTVSARSIAPPSAWSRNQRPIRQPIFPAAGRWRSFSG